MGSMCFYLTTKLKSSHQPETRPVLRAHGLQLGIGLPSPAKDFKDLARGGAGMGFDLICWISFRGVHVRMHVGFPKATCPPNKAAKHAWFFRFDWAYTVLMPGNGAVKWLQTQRIKQLGNLETA